MDVRGGSGVNRIAGRPVKLFCTLQQSSEFSSQQSVQPAPFPLLQENTACHVPPAMRRGRS